MIMRLIKNLKLRVKLILTFVIVAILMIIVLGIGYVAMNKTADNDDRLYHEVTVPLTIIPDMLDNINDQQQLIAMSALADGVSYQEVLTELERFSLEMDEMYAQMGEVLTDEHAIELWHDLLEKYNVFSGFKTKIINFLKMDNKPAVVYAYSGAEMQKAMEDVEDSMEALAERLYEMGQERGDYNKSAFHMWRRKFIIVLFVNLLIAAYIVIVVLKSIANPLNEVIKAAEKLVVGDIEAELRWESRDELGYLSDTFRKIIADTKQQAAVLQTLAENDFTPDIHLRSEKDVLNRSLAEMIKNSNDMVRKIATASEQVAVGAEQLSAASKEISQGAAQQASALEQLTASMEEISVQTGENAENAKKADKLAEAAKSNADNGNHLMQDMLKAIEDISVSSKNINKILKAIDDIAFQTNILSLNAAVEAARAGNYGKGFAVVAEEIRALAEKSAEAAKQSGELIENAMEKVAHGTKIAGETAEALKRIVSGAEEVASLVGSIAAASEEQAIGIAQINQGISQVSEVVQKNSATSEEVAASEEALRHQAEGLKDIVESIKFKEFTDEKTDFELSPEVLEYLESIYKKKYQTNVVCPDEENVSTSLVAVPSDKEFGKY
jgi:methyl-accepting chemotaxis protein